MSKLIEVNKLTNLLNLFIKSNAFYKMKVLIIYQNKKVYTLQAKLRGRKCTLTY